MNRDVEIEGRRLGLTNLDRVLWPDAGTTKEEMIAYYRRVAPALLPHLQGRPLTLGRFPEGVRERGWYQSNCRGSPDWLRTHEIESRRGDVLRHCVVEDEAGLVWVANQGTIELHPYLWTIDAPERAREIVFDLDPGPPAGVAASAGVAAWVREALRDRGVAAFPKTSGFKGMHVYAPLDPPASFQTARAFARAVAELVAEERPHLALTDPGRSLREGRVLIDWRQNDPRRSTIAPYSLRGTRLPSVSTPVSWEEVADIADGREPRFGPPQVVERIEQLGDLFGDLPALRQSLPST